MHHYAGKRSNYSNLFLRCDPWPPQDYKCLHFMVNKITVITFNSTSFWETKNDRNGTIWGEFFCSHLFCRQLHVSSAAVFNEVAPSLTLSGRGMWINLVSEKSLNFGLPGRPTRKRAVIGLQSLGGGSQKGTLLHRGPVSLQTALNPVQNPDFDTCRCIYRTLTNWKQENRSKLGKKESPPCPWMCPSRCSSGGKSCWVVRAALSLSLTAATCPSS